MIGQAKCATLVLLILSGGLFASNVLSLNEETLRARLSLEIEEDKVKTLIEVDIPSSNETRVFLILVPFAVDETISSFPSEFVCSCEIVLNQYTVFSLTVPSGGRRAEILAASKSLEIRSDDLRKIEISFEYHDPPSVIADILDYSNSISHFEMVQVTFPADIEMDLVMTTPPPFNATDNTYCYRMIDILESIKGTLSIKYSVQGSAWLFLLLVGVSIGISPSLALTRHKPSQEGNRRFLYLIPIGFVFATASFSILMFLTRGIRWDYLALYLPCTIEISMAMGLWLVRILGRTQH